MRLFSAWSGKGGHDDVVNTTAMMRKAAAARPPAGYTRTNFVPTHTPLDDHGSDLLVSKLLLDNLLGGPHGSIEVLEGLGYDVNYLIDLGVLR